MLNSGLANPHDNGAAHAPRPAARQLQSVASRPVTHVPSSNLACNDDSICASVYPTEPVSNASSLISTKRSRSGAARERRILISRAQSGHSPSKYSVSGHFVVSYIDEGSRIGFPHSIPKHPGRQWALQYPAPASEIINNQKKCQSAKPTGISFTHFKRSKTNVQSSLIRTRDRRCPGSGR